MRVRLLARRAGLPGEPGEVRDAAEEEARRLVGEGRAEQVAPPAKLTKRVGGETVETAAAPPRTERRG